MTEHTARELEKLLRKGVYMFFKQPDTRYRAENLLLLLLWFPAGKDDGCVFIRSLRSRRVPFTGADLVQRYQF